jgi:hypothetical protein
MYSSKDRVFVDEFKNERVFVLCGTPYDPSSPNLSLFEKKKSVLCVDLGK